MNYWYIEPACSTLLPLLFLLLLLSGFGVVVRGGTLNSERSHYGCQSLAMREQNQNVGICLSCAFVQPANVVLLIFLSIHEKDGKIKSVEELLQAEILKVASKEKTVQVFISAISTFLFLCLCLWLPFICYCMAFYSDEFVASIFVAFLCFHCPILSVLSLKRLWHRK